MSKKLISVITSAYNEELSIRRCYEEVKAVMVTVSDRYDYEHVFADNCSEDKTLEILQEIAKNDPNVRVLANSRNFGAEKSGFNCLAHASGDAVIGMAADLQEPPPTILEMVKVWEQGYEVVFGVYENPHEALTLRLTRKLYYWLVTHLSTDPLPRNSIGWALMDRRVVDEIVAADDFAPYTRGLIAMIGFRQIAIPYVRNKRIAGESKHRFAFLLDFGLNGLISHSLAPIRAASLVGLALFAVSVVVTITLPILKLVKPTFLIPSQTTMVVLVTFFAGVQLLFLGLLGEYIGAIHSQVRRKPFVIVRETVNFPEEYATASGTPTLSLARMRRDIIRARRARE